MARLSPVNPHPAQIFLGELHHSVEPFPESEAPVRQRLLAELHITLQYCTAD